MTEANRVRSGLSLEPGVMPAVLRLLGFVDRLPAGATGALSFAEHGLILLESRKVCWAVSRSMPPRLTQILQNQSSPPLPRAAFERIYRACRASGKPLAEALIQSGLVSEAGARAAMLEHNAEAIIHLASTGLAPIRFVSHTRTGYDPRYAFSPCELLARLGAQADPDRALAARVELENILVPDSWGAAFARSAAAANALVIAVDPLCDVPVQDLVQICSWTAGLFDVACTFDPRTTLARASWGASLALVGWRSTDASFVGLCSSRAAAARLICRLENTTKRSGVMAVATRQGSGVQ